MTAQSIKDLIAVGAVDDKTALKLIDKAIALNNERLMELQKENTALVNIKLKLIRSMS
jgi:hypothetical protein